MNKTQKGFAVIETLLIMVVVAIIGGTGYYVWHSKNITNNSLNKTANVNQKAPGKTSSASGTTSPAQPPSSTYKTFSDSGYGIAFDFPDNWTVEKLQITPDHDIVVYDSSHNQRLYLSDRGPNFGDVPQAIDSVAGEMSLMVGQNTIKVIKNCSISCYFEGDAGTKEVTVLILTGDKDWTTVQRILGTMTGLSNLHNYVSGMHDYGSAAN